MVIASLTLAGGLALRQKESAVVKTAKSSTSSNSLAVRDPSKNEIKKASQELEERKVPNQGEANPADLLDLATNYGDLSAHDLDQQVVAIDKQIELNKLIEKVNGGLANQEQRELLTNLMQKRSVLLMGKINRQLGELRGYLGAYDLR